MAATGGACLNLHSNPDDCYAVQEKKIVKNLEESMGWGYNGQITYGDDECLWPKYGLPLSGTEIVAVPCKDNKTDQKWEQIKLTGDHDGYYQYKHEDSKRCMGMKKGKVILKKCNAGDGKQHWKFSGVGKDY